MLCMTDIATARLTSTECPFQPSLLVGMKASSLALSAIRMRYIIACNIDRSSQMKRITLQNGTK